jgi:nucleoid-associated protein YejK
MKTLFFILFFTNALFAQDLDYLKSQDTLYLMVPKKDSLKLSQFTFRADGNDALSSYNFKQSDGKYIHIETMNDREVDTVKRNLTVKRKTFLKNNKKNIIDLNFLYIINEKDTSRKRIALKKAYILDVSFIEM